MNARQRFLTSPKSAIGPHHDLVIYSDRSNSTCTACCPCRRTANKPASIYCPLGKSVFRVTKTRARKALRLITTSLPQPHPKRSLTQHPGRLRPIRATPFHRSMRHGMAIHENAPARDRPRAPFSSLFAAYRDTAPIRPRFALGPSSSAISL